MLVLTRREDETVKLYTTSGEVVEVVVLKTRSGSVRLGFVADGVRIVRGELKDQPEQRGAA